eukprot:7382406-Prymnesium_polylepis.3
MLAGRTTCRRCCRSGRPRRVNHHGVMVDRSESRARQQHQESRGGEGRAWDLRKMGWTASPSSRRGRLTGMPSGRVAGHVAIKRRACAAAPLGCSDPSDAARLLGTGTTRLPIQLHRLAQHELRWCAASVQGAFPSGSPRRRTGRTTSGNPHAPWEHM